MCFHKHTIKVWVRFFHLVQWHLCLTRHTWQCVLVSSKIQTQHPRWNLGHLKWSISVQSSCCKVRKRKVSSSMGGLWFAHLASQWFLQKANSIENCISGQTCWQRLIADIWSGPDIFWCGLSSLLGWRVCVHLRDTHFVYPALKLGQWTNNLLFFSRLFDRGRCEVHCFIDMTCNYSESVGFFSTLPHETCFYFLFWRLNEKTRV